MTTTTVDPGSLPRSLRPFAEAAAAGAVTLPKPVLAAIARVRELTEAAAVASSAAEEARTASDASRAAVVRSLAADGPTPSPSKAVREAADVAKALTADAELYRDGIRRAEARIETAFLDASRDLAGQLTATLAATLAAARPDAAILAAVRVAWSDPDAIHELAPEPAAAFHRLVPLARRHAATLAAAFALWNDLHRAGRADTPARRALLIELDRAASKRGPRQPTDDEWLASFALAGYLTGPAGKFAGTGDPRHATRWAIVTTGEHPVARLVRATLAQPDPIEPDEPEPPARDHVQRTPIAPGPGLLGR